MILTVLLLFSSAIADQPCLPTLSKGSRCTEKILNLRPTQPEIGRREVKKKTRKILGESEKKLLLHVEKKTAPAVIGPDGKLYIVDRHHSLLALHEAGVEVASVEILENWSQMPGKTMNEKMRAFWDRMRLANYCWLTTESGVVVDPLSLDFPLDLTECQNNRLRSVVYELIQDGVLTKEATPYFEFEVADALRVAGFRAEDGEVKETLAKAKAFLGTPEGRKMLENVRCRGRLGRTGPANEDED